MNSQGPEQASPGNPANLAEAQELFQRSVERLDVATGNRLRLMRRAALSAPAARWSPRLLPAAATTLAMLLLGLNWWLPFDAIEQGAEQGNPAAASQTQFAGDDDAELYAWLGEAPVAVDPPGASL